MTGDILFHRGLISIRIYSDGRVISRYVVSNSTDYLRISATKSDWRLSVID